MAETISVNVAYAIYVASGLVKTEWRLRAVLVVVSIAFIVWALIAGVWSAVFWNVLFGSTHGYTLLRMWMRNRAIQISSEAAAVHERVFPSLSRVDFFTLWSLGNTERYEPDDVIIELGSKVQAISIVLGGECTVTREGTTLAELGADALLGERSYVTGQPASATVSARNDVMVHEWNQEKISALVEICPNAHAAIVEHIGVDLAAKLG